jgi:CDP-glucose 4,6-dehydratase
LNPDFWAGRRVLLTGHTGFTGAWLALWLRKLGAKVSGYALAPATKPSLYREANVRKSLAHEAIANVQEASKLRSFFRKSKPEIVLHLAAQSLVHRGYAEPVETYSTNVMGTVNVLEAVRATPGVRAVVVVTTDKCYENRELSRGYTEADPLGGSDPYASSKAAAELVTSAYRSSYFKSGAAIAAARAGNIVGGGDWSADRLMTDLVAALRAGRPVRLRHPEAVRPWQHVLDALHGYLLLADALAERGAGFAEGWNFGPAAEEARPVSWIVETATRLWGAGAKWQRDGDEHPHETTQLRLDAGKARARLSWQPVLGIEEALAWSVDWYRRHAEKSTAAAALCDEQIARFMERAAS